MHASKSKTLATWLALTLGSLGAHRFYLYGKRDWLAWLHPLPTLLGLGGLVRMNNLGQDDLAAWLLVPLFGLMLSIAMASAILIGLTPDEKWHARHNPAVAGRPAGWLAVIGVVLALLLGGAFFMGALAFGGQKYFEYQALRAAEAAR